MVCFFNIILINYFIFQFQKLQLLFLSLAILLALSAGRRSRLDSSSSDQSEESDSQSQEDAATPARNRLGVTFDELLQFRPSPEAENLSGQALVDYVNRRQNLWRVIFLGFFSFQLFFRPN